MYISRWTKPQRIFWLEFRRADNQGKHSLYICCNLSMYPAVNINQRHGLEGSLRWHGDSQLRLVVCNFAREAVLKAQPNPQAQGHRQCHGAYSHVRWGELQPRSSSCPAGAAEPPRKELSIISRRRHPTPSFYQLSCGRIQISTPRALDSVTAETPSSSQEPATPFGQLSCRRSRTIRPRANSVTDTARSFGLPATTFGQLSCRCSRTSEPY
jgi:hypothetical protein